MLFYGSYRKQCTGVFKFYGSISVYLLLQQRLDALRVKAEHPLAVDVRLRNPHLAGCLDKAASRYWIFLDIDVCVSDAVLVQEILEHRAVWACVR